MPAANIVEVIARLDVIVAESKTRHDPLGYFAAMYRAVTRRIKHDIDGGLFDDGPRMDRVDTTFANFYLQAYAAHQSGAAVSAPWRLVFEHAQRTPQGVFQHLLLGMNAHINFDLGQAVVEDDPANLPALAGDYDRINEILVDLLGPLQNVVEKHLLGGPFVDCMLGQLDERFAGWEMKKARAHAWEHAQELAAASADERAVITLHMERFTVGLAEQRLVPQHTPTAAAWWLARRIERTDVVAIIESIESVS